MSYTNFRNLVKGGGGMTLLPCPFCGGEARLQKFFAYGVNCTECDAQAELANDKATAAANWNRRHAGGVAK